MQVFTQFAVTMDPVVTIWTENNAQKAKIHRDAQTAMAFFFDNNLWDNSGKLFAEDGTELTAPPKP